MPRSLQPLELTQYAREDAREYHGSDDCNSFILLAFYSSYRAAFL
jgi:hypothetical protein